MTHPNPTGRIEQRDDGRYLVFERTLPYPIERVWASLTESDQLELWIGRWEGDPATGQVAFSMTAEGSTEPELCTIAECHSPRRFVCDTQAGEQSWRLSFDLAEAGDGGDATRFTFAQRLNPSEDIGEMGAGWDYYLDRHAATLEDRLASDIVWDDYYPALAEHYATLDAASAN